MSDSSESDQAVRKAQKRAQLAWALRLAPGLASTTRRAGRPAADRAKLRRAT